MNRKKAEIGVQLGTAVGAIGILLAILGLSPWLSHAGDSHHGSRNAYERPSAEEALAFLQSLPPIASKIEGEKRMVNPWKNKTIDDIKTMKKIQPGGHLASGDHLRISGDDWKYFTAFEKLETATLFEIAGADDRAFYHLGHLPQSVNYIFVELGELADDGVRHLQQLKNLRFLAIGSTDTITDEALQHMARIPSLEEIRVSGCKGIHGPGMTYLAGMKNLRRLFVARTSMTDTSLAHFRDLTIDELNLSGNNITVNGLKGLLDDNKSLPNLKRLTLQNVTLSVESLSELKKLRPDIQIDN